MKALILTIVGAVSFFPALSYGGAQLGTLDTTSYNFPLSGGGGGASASFTPNGSVSATLLEIFCVDFANDIYVAQNGYSAYLSPLLSTTAAAGTDTAPGELSDTRDGGVSSSSFVQLTSSDYGTSAFTAADASFIDSASALERYQMAAYLVSTYDIGDGGSNANNGIQEAIWEILDPGTDPSIASDVSPLGVSLTSSYVATALDSAATWLSSYVTPGTETAINNLNSFLSNYRIVSDATMNSSCAANAVSGVLCGGFQEQITAVPEPRHIAFLLVGLLLVFGVRLRKSLLF